jgi:hypothetical protein
VNPVYVAIVVAAIAAVAAMVSPLLLASLTGKQRRVEKLEDRAYAELVAQRVEAKAAAEAAAVHGKLAKIETLVNGSLTASMVSELATARRALALMRDLSTLRLTYTGESPSPTSAGEIAVAEAKVAALEQGLEVRREQYRKAGVQMTATEDS